MTGITRRSKWRKAMIAKLRSGEHKSFGGNTPDVDKEDALSWLRGFYVREGARDFKVVVRTKYVEQRTIFRYRLCVGALGYSADDYNWYIEVVEGKDF